MDLRLWLLVFCDEVLALKVMQNKKTMRNINFKTKKTPALDWRSFISSIIS